MRKLLGLISFVLIITLVSGTSFAGWLIYHKPAFKGKVIDAETKEPIERAVVVAVYEKEEIRLAPESMTAIKHVREVLTGEDGSFLIPSYTSITDPLSSYFTVTFIIFKPGYGSFPDWRISPPKLKLSKVPYGTFWYGERDMTFEEFFSEEVGTVKEFWSREFLKEEEKPKKISVEMGIVELPKLKTREERMRNIPSLPSWDELLENQRNLIRLINEEEENLGLQKSDPFKAREFILKERGK